MTALLLMRGDGLVLLATRLSDLRVEDSSWDYQGEFTKGYTHRFHSYPAMMLPQVARRLIREQGRPVRGPHSDGRRLLKALGRLSGALTGWWRPKPAWDLGHRTVLDPFCGSGGVLVEARLAGCNGWGIDLNPLGILVARAKTTPLDPAVLTGAYARLIKRAAELSGDEAPPPCFPNIDFWFKPEVISRLAKLRAAILEIQDRAVRDFFAVAFSETARLVSNSRRHEFKLYRYEAAKLKDYSPDVLATFRDKVEKNIEGMREFYGQAPRNTWVRLLLADASQPNEIPEGSVDLVVTSPPYGDSRTTVAYGQFSRLSAQWLYPLLLEQPPIGDRQLLGGSPSPHLATSLHSPTLAEALAAIAERDERRAREVLSFYEGLNRCLAQIVKKVRRGGRLCFVVGNRRVKGVQLPTDLIIAELSQELGLEAKSIIIRNIPSKRMPLRNSPTNVPGEVQETMHREHITILEKVL